MLAHTRRLVRRALLTLLLLLLTAWAVIAYFAWQAAPLQLWHTVVPPELSTDELDSSDWPAIATIRTPPSIPPAFSRTGTAPTCCAPRGKSKGWRCCCTA